MAGHSQDCRKAHVNVSGNVFFRDHCPSVETNPCKKNNNSSRRYLKATGPLGRDLQVLVRDLMPVNFQRRQLQSLKLDMPWSPRCPQFLATRVETCGPESGLLPTGSQWPPAALLHFITSDVFTCLPGFILWTSILHLLNFPKTIARFTKEMQHHVPAFCG